MIEPEEFNPDWRVHPGNTLRELFIHRVLDNVRLTREEEEKTVRQLSEILNGRGRITPDLAEILQEVLKISASFFLNLQANFETSKAWDTTLPDGRRERRGYLSVEEQELHKDQGCEVLIESDGYTTVREEK